MTDGTVDGAERLTDLQELNETGGIIQLTTIDDVLFFAAKEEATGFELWRSEGTEDETMRLTDLNVGEEDSLSDTSDIPMMGALGTHVYFAADDGVHGTELWRVHKSGAPVELVQDLVPGPGASNPHNFTLINGRLWSAARAASVVPSGRSLLSASTELVLYQLSLSLSLIAKIEQPRFAFI